MKDHDLTWDQVEDYVDYFFATFRKFITDPRMPKIQITNFGTFKPSIGKINFTVGFVIKLHKYGRISREECVERITPLLKVKQRLIKEKAGLETWKEWRKKKL